MSEEKKVNETEETKVNETEEKHGVELTDEKLSSVAAGWPGGMNLTPDPLIIR